MEGLGAGFETVIENEGGDSNVAKKVNLQGIRSHLQIVDTAQSIVFALSPRHRVKAPGRRACKFRELWTVEMITVQLAEIFFFCRKKNLEETVLDLRPFLRSVRL
jgi:hypothetical protein